VWDSVLGALEPGFNHIGIHAAQAVPGGKTGDVVDHHSAADDAEDFALADLAADVAPGPELAADALAVVGVADLEPGAGWARALAGIPGPG
jgi:hypothetical protein